MSRVTVTSGEQKLQNGMVRSPGSYGALGAEAEMRSRLFCGDRVLFRAPGGSPQVRAPGEVFELAACDPDGVSIEVLGEERDGRRLSLAILELPGISDIPPNSVAVFKIRCAPTIVVDVICRRRGALIDDEDECAGTVEVVCCYEMDAVRSESRARASVGRFTQVVGSWRALATAWFSSDPSTGSRAAAPLGWALASLTATALVGALTYQMGQNRVLREREDGELQGTAMIADSRAVRERVLLSWLQQRLDARHK
jgi:hypothetical protein